MKRYAEVIILLCVLLCIASTALAATNNSALRSRKVAYAFRTAHPCPVNGSKHGVCPGYIVDHIQALECGGADSTSNMQWQTSADAKAKDKLEHLCRIKK